MVFNLLEMRRMKKCENCNKSNHRTNEETSNVSKVLDGEIDIFIESNLKKGK